MTFRNRCDVLEIAANTRREVARFAVSCQVTLAAIKFGFRPFAAGGELNLERLLEIKSGLLSPKLT